MKQELLNGLTEEQIAKVKACKSQAEILELAKKEGVALTDEQLEAVSGGCNTSRPTVCPKCQSPNFSETWCNSDASRVRYVCNACQCKFEYAPRVGVEIIG